MSDGTATMSVTAKESSATAGVAKVILAIDLKFKSVAPVFCKVE